MDFFENRKTSRKIEKMADRKLQPLVVYARIRQMRQEAVLMADSRSSQKDGRSVILSFLLVYSLFAVLILLSALPAYHYFSTFVTNTTINGYQELLNTGARSLDATLSTLNSAVLATAKDARFSVFKYKNPEESMNPLQLPELSSALNSLLLSDEIIADAGILFSADVVITRHSNFYGRRFHFLYPDFLSCGEMDENEWRAALMDNGPLLPAMQYTSGYSSFEALTYCTSWSSGGYVSKSTFFALIPVEPLLHLCSDDEVLLHGYVEILDSGGNTLAFRQGDSAGACYEIEARTNQYALTLRVGVPSVIIQQKMQVFRRMILLFVSGMVVFALVLALLFASRASMPIRRLYRLIHATPHVSEEYARHASRERGLRTRYAQNMDQLAQSIGAIEHRFEDYECTISAQRTSLRAQLLNQAMHRSLSDSDAFHDLFPEFPSQYRLCLLRYELPEGSAIDLAARLQMNIAAMVRSETENVIVHGMDGDALALILPETENSDCVIRLQQLRDRLIQQMGLPVGFALSDVFSGTEALSNAYQQTQFLFAASPDPFVLSVEQMKDLPAQKHPLPLSYSELSAMYAALSAGNLSAVLFTLEECTEKLAGADVELKRHVFNQLTDLMNHVRLENPALLYDLTLPAFGNDAQLPVDFAPYAEFICEARNSEQEDQTHMFSQKILAYVNERLYDPELYVQSVANAFSISPPTLQKMIRQATGLTFAAYVEQERLKYACVLFAESDLSVQEVAAKCGFISPNTFYKSFRRKYGRPPQAIRKS